MITVTLFKITTTAEVILVARNWMTGKAIASPGEDLPYAVTDGMRLVAGEPAAITFVDTEHGNQLIKFNGGIVQTVEQLPDVTEYPSRG